MNPEVLNSEVTRHNRFQHISNVKWAFICLGIGISLVMLDIFPDLLSEAGAMGIMFIGAGLGFLGYFFVAQKHMKQDKRDQDQ
jgi:hypothetical protein